MPLRRNLFQFLIPLVSSALFIPYCQSYLIKIDSYSINKKGKISDISFNNALSTVKIFLFCADFIYLHGRLSPLMRNETIMVWNFTSILFRFSLLSSCFGSFLRNKFAYETIYSNCAMTGSKRHICSAPRTGKRFRQKCRIISGMDLKGLLN